MSFRTYNEGLKIASDTANKAVLAESSLSALSPLVSPLPTLLKAFPLYIAAAEAYSHLLSSRLVPDQEVAGVKRKWRLVLERAEKVKKRVEELGGKVGKSEVGDEGEEAAVVRRGGRVNGIEIEEWRGVPSDREFALHGRAGGGFDPPFVGLKPELAQEQIAAGVEWASTNPSSWHSVLPAGQRCVVTQGTGADCSVVAGMSVCLEHDRRWGTNLALGNLYPQDAAVKPLRSDNGKHVVKLMLNGAWRSTVIDALLPRQQATGSPLHPTVKVLPQQPRSTSCQDAMASTGYVDCAVPLVLSAYFLTHGGYSLRGSNPAPDIYALTGWIPERLSFREGFQREKEWRRLSEAWSKGQVLITLGTGENAGDGLVKLHAYAVLDLREVHGERLVEIWDPGLPTGSDPSAPIAEAVQRLSLDGDRASVPPRGGLFTMSWDEVCAQFGSLNANWNPSIRPVRAVRHWHKPAAMAEEMSADFASSPRFRCKVSSNAGSAPDEIWLLLSQHIKGKDTPMDDIALHVFAEHSGGMSAVQPYRLETVPFANAQHVLVRYRLRDPSANLLILPTRDRGFARTDFTLQAFAPEGTSLELERVSRSLAFSQQIRGRLSGRNSGGHSSLPSYGSNPQYRLTVGSPQTRGERIQVRVSVRGQADHAYNVKLLWGDGQLVHDVSEDAVLGDSGPYTYGVAYADMAAVDPGNYTLVVSTFEPGTMSPYTVDVESTAAISVAPIPQEGAGMYHRSAEGLWTDENTGGRPSCGKYESNPKVEVILPRAATVMARAHHPSGAVSAFLNLTLFRRSEGSKLGSQVATSGPYSDAVSGVRIPRTTVAEPGVYVLVVSAYEAGAAKGARWRLDVWADSTFEVEKVE